MRAILDVSMMVVVSSSVQFGLNLPSTGYFICILFSWHDHVFREQYMDNFMVIIPEMLTHARATGTKPLFASRTPLWHNKVWGAHRSEGQGK